MSLEIKGKLNFFFFFTFFSCFILKDSNLSNNSSILRDSLNSNKLSLGKFLIFKILKLNSK